MALATRGFVLVLACAFSGCASYYVGSQVQSGRRALLAHDPERALPYFLDAAKTKPDYIYTSQYFREGVWTYLGRSQYAANQYQEARQSLERALKVDQDDNLARLYLGLTLVRLNDPSRGLKEIEAAMKGIHDWLEYMERSRPFEVYWDPARDIRTSMSLRRPGKTSAANNWSRMQSGWVREWKTKWSALAGTRDGSMSGNLIHGVTHQPQRLVFQPTFLVRIFTELSAESARDLIGFC